MFKRNLLRLAIAALIVAGISTQASNASATEWRWSKPLNQKPGSLLYTTNVRAKTKTQTRGIITPQWYSNQPVRTNYRPMRRPVFTTSPWFRR